TRNTSNDSETLLKRHIALFWSVNQTLPSASVLTAHDIDHEGTLVNGCWSEGHSGMLYSLNLFSEALYVPSSPRFAETYHTWPPSNAIPAGISHSCGSTNSLTYALEFAFASRPHHCCWNLW